MPDDAMTPSQEALSSLMYALDHANTKLMEARDALDNRTLEQSPDALRAGVEAWSQVAKQLRVLTAQLMMLR